VLRHCVPALVAVAVAAPLLWHAATAASALTGPALLRFAASTAPATAFAARRILRSAGRRDGP